MKKDEGLEMNAGNGKEPNNSVVYLSADMMDISDAIVMSWGAMALDDGQVSMAWNMAEALKKAGGEKEEISRDQFFEVCEPFMQRMAVIDYHYSEFGRNRVLAVLYDGLIAQVAEDLGNDKEALLVAAKEKYPGFEWEFHPP